MRGPALVALLLVSAPPAPAGEPLDRARELLRTGRYEEALEALEVTGADGDAEREVLLARACNAVGDWDRGARHARRAIELRPESSEAHYRLAEALRIKMTKVSRMKALFVVGSYRDALGRALALDPGNVLAREEEIGFLMHAPAIAGGSVSRARERIAELEPIDWRRAMMMRSTLELRAENDDEAVRLLQQILLRHPDDAGAHLTLAGWYRAHGRFAEADRHYAAIVDGDNLAASLEALYERARTRLIGGYEPERAIELLRRFLELSPTARAGAPGPAAAYRALGSAYERLARWSEAEESYRLALQLDRSDTEARRALEALRRRD